MCCHCLPAVHLAPAISRNGSVGRPGRSATRDYYCDDLIVANDAVAVKLDLKRVVTFPISFIHSPFHRFLSLHATGFSDGSRGRH